MADTFTLSGKVNLETGAATRNLKDFQGELRRTVTALSGVAGDTTAKINFTSNAGSVLKDLQGVLRQVRAMSKLADVTAAVKVEAKVDQAKARLGEVVNFIRDIKKSADIVITITTKGAGGSGGSNDPLRAQKQAAAEWARAIEKDAQQAAQAEARAFKQSGAQIIAASKERLAQQKADGASWAREIEAEYRRNGVSINRFGDETKTVTGHLRQLNNTASHALDGFEGKVNSARGMLKGLAQSALSVAAGMGIYNGLASVFNVLKDGFKLAIGYDSDLQKNLIGTENLLHGNTAAAKELQAQVEQFALHTSFQFKDLMPIEQQLLAANVAAKEIVPTLRAAGDAAAGLVRGQDGLNHIVLALSQLNATGKVTGETLKELRHVGVNALQFLADSWHVSTTKMQEDISKGMIPAKEGFNAIVAGMERQFHGQLEKMSGTAEGAWSNIKDATSKILGAAFADTFKWISQMAVKLANIASNKDFQKWCGEVQLRLKIAFGIGVDVVKAFWDVLKAVGQGVGAVFTFIFNSAKWMAQGLYDEFKSIAQSIAQIFDFLTAPIQRLMGANNFAGSNLEKGFAAIENRAGQFKDNLQSNFADVGRFYANILPPATDWSKWSQNMAGDKTKVPDMPDNRGKFLNSDKAGEKAAKAAVAAAKRLLTDQLQDAVKYYDARAKAAEASVKREMDALTAVRDKLREIFNGAQESLLKAGIIDNPLGSLIAGFEKWVGLEPKMRGLAAATKAAVDAANAHKAGLQSRLDTLQGGDGVGPGYGGAALAGGAGGSIEGHAARVSHSLITQIAASIEQPSGISACAYVASRILKGIGIHIEGTNSAAGLRRNAVAMGAHEIPYGQARAGDLINWRGAGYGANGSGNHVGVYEGDGYYSGNQGHAPRIHKSVYDLDHAHFYNTSQFMNGAAGAAAGGKLPSYLPKNNSAALAQLFGGDSSLFSNLDGTLSKITAVPKAWGAAVKDSEGHTARFAAQTMLANREFLQFLNTITGDHPDAAIKKIRAITNAADDLANRVKAMATARAYLAEMRAKTRQIGLANDPLAQLDDDFANNPAYKDIGGAARDSMRQALQANLEAQATQATKDYAKEQAQAIRVSQEHVKWLQSLSSDSIAYARNNEILTEKQKLENQVIAEGIPLWERAGVVADRLGFFVQRLNQEAKENGISKLASYFNSLANNATGFASENGLLPNLASLKQDALQRLSAGPMGMLSNGLNNGLSFMSGVLGGDMKQVADQRQAAAGPLDAAKLATEKFKTELEDKQNDLKGLTDIQKQELAWRKQDLALQRSGVTLSDTQTAAIAAQRDQARLLLHELENINRVEKQRAVTEQNIRAFAESIKGSLNNAFASVLQGHGIKGALNGLVNDFRNQLNQITAQILSNITTNALIKKFPDLFKRGGELVGAANEGLDLAPAMASFQSAVSIFDPAVTMFGDFVTQFQAATEQAAGGGFGGGGGGDAASSSGGGFDGLLGSLGGIVGMPGAAAGAAGGGMDIAAMGSVAGPQGMSRARAPHIQVHIHNHAPIHVKSDKPGDAASGIAGKALGQAHSQHTLQRQVKHFLGIQ